MKMRILFVDDQTNLLAALRRMLRSLRNEWDMEFADSGASALALMENAHFDVVVSDVRMPGMDGVDFLTEVMAHYPSTVRIILSGQADQDTVLRSVTPAHQYLSKPCDAETLKNTIARACSLRNTLSQQTLILLVSRVTTLPSLPHVYSELVNELQSEDASVRRVGELVSQDVGMTAKLMQMVNSSFFGIPRPVKSPAQAVALLGLKILKPLVLSAGIFSQFEDLQLSGYSVEHLVEHSLAVGHLSEQIAKRHGETQIVEDALIAGLLHDVGQLVLAANIPNDFCEVQTLARTSSMRLCDAEAEVFGASHADVGAYLLGLWGLADPIIEAVAYHHHPRRCGKCDFSPLTAVHVANALILEMDSTLASKEPMDADYLNSVGVADCVSQWRELAESLCTTEIS